MSNYLHKSGANKRRDKQQRVSEGRLNDLAMLSIEAELAKRIDLQDIINDFAIKKARKAFC